MPPVTGVGRTLARGGGMVTTVGPQRGAFIQRVGHLRCLLLVVAFATGTSCAVNRQASRDITATKIRQMHGALLGYRVLEGQLPDSLDLVCDRHARLCELSSSKRWKVDGWGRPFFYLRSDGHFELRSVGEDGLSGTPDDVWISSLAEQQRVRLFAACYRMPLQWWKAFTGDQVILDTIPLGSGYTLLPDAGPYVGRWIPEGTDSARLSWIRGDQSVTLLLRLQGDSLVGRALGTNRPVIGVKIRCP